MREIKFREWDSVRQEIYQPDCNWGLSYSRREDFDDMVGFRFRHMESDEDWEDDDQGEPRRVLEQYTGLKDKNGREIYEGDILCYTDMDGDSFFAPIKYCADDDYPVFDFDHQYIPDGYFFESNAIAEGVALGCISVAGNIHENPELLEVDQ